MFTRSVRVGCSFPACREDSEKYRTCFIFLPPLPILVTDPKFIHLATGMSVNLMASRLHFPAYRLIKQVCLYQVSGLSQIWSSRLYVMTNRLCGKCYSTVGNWPVCNCPERPVRFQGQSVTFTNCVLESGNFITDRP